MSASLLLWCAYDLVLMFKWLVLLVLGTIANEPFEVFFAITLLPGLGMMIDRWFMSNPTE